MDEQFDDVYAKALNSTIYARPFLWPKSTSEMSQYVNYDKAALNKPLDDKPTKVSNMSSVNKTDAELSKQLWS